VKSAVRDLICVNADPTRHDSLPPIPSQRDAPMRRFVLKAVLTALAVNRAEKRRLDWDRIILIASTSVTIGLVALYAYGKATARW